MIITPKLLKDYNESRENLISKNDKLKVYFPHLMNPEVDFENGKIDEMINDIASQNSMYDVKNSGNIK